LKPKNENTTEDKKEIPGVMEVFKTREVWVTTLFYCFLSFLFTGFQNTLPLWVTRSKSDYGFSWNSAKIGTLFAIVGPCYTISQLILFPKCIAKLGYVGVAKYFSLIYGLLVIIIPHFASARNWNEIVLFTLFTIYVVIAVCFRGMAFGVTYIFINNAGSKKYCATANGIGQTLVKCWSAICTNIFG